MSLNDSFKDLQFKMELIENYLVKAKDYADIGYRFAFKLSRKEEHCGTEEYWNGVAEEVVECLGDIQRVLSLVLDEIIEEESL